MKITQEVKNAKERPNRLTKVVANARGLLGVAKLTFCAPNTLVTAGVIFLLCDASRSSSLSNQTFILSEIISITARQAVSSEF